MKKETLYLLGFYVFVLAIVILIWSFVDPAQNQWHAHQSNVNTIHKKQ